MNNFLKFKQLFSKLFSKNGRILAISMMLGVMALMIWYYWSSGEVDKAYEVSHSYEITMNEIRTDRTNLSTAERFIANNKNIYGILAELEVAKVYVDKNELDKAVFHLKNSISTTDDDNLKELINLRLARIQVQQKKSDIAIKTLSSIKGEGFSSMVSNLCGQALLNKGDHQDARNVWEGSIKNNPSSTMNEIIQMKINQLSV